MLRVGVRGETSTAAAFAPGEGYEIVAAFVEVETGKGSDALVWSPELVAGPAKTRALRGPVAAALAEKERALIPGWTRSALAPAKAGLQARQIRSSRMLGVGPRGGQDGGRPCRWEYLPIIRNP
jgi:hypothetical protein